MSARNIFGMGQVEREAGVMRNTKPLVFDFCGLSSWQDFDPDSTFPLSRWCECLPLSFLSALAYAIGVD